MSQIEPRVFLASLFFAAVQAADPFEAIRRHLPPRPKGRTIVIGAGKAASQMAAAFERAWDGPLEGLVVAKHGPVQPCRHIAIMQSAHPVPDQSGMLAAEALAQRLDGLSEDDLVVALISGGGSALLPAPPAGFTLADEIRLSQALLACGAPISAMNLIRKHFSRVKGGRLAAAAFPARVVSLIVSDVPGDNPALVASGPTVPDYGDAEEALRLIRDFHIDLDAAMIASIGATRAPDPGDSVFARNEVHIVASAAVSLAAAAEHARSRGVNALVLSDSIEGEARDIGRMHAALAREFLGRPPFAKPLVLLSGGETTVTIGNDACGKGGRNAEFLLSAALDLQGQAGIAALAADTDGIDGSEDNAGAYCDSDSIGRMRMAGTDPRACLAQHDAWSAFNASDDLFVSGPTGTNVNDFRAFLINA